MINVNKEGKKRSGQGTEKKKPSTAKLVTWLIILSLVVLVLMYLLITNTFSSLGLVVFFASYTVATIIALLYMILRGERLMQKLVNSKASVTADMPLGQYAVLAQPVAVCDREARIAWMNNAFFAKADPALLVSDDLRLSAFITITNAARFTDKDSFGSPVPMAIPMLLDHMASHKTGISGVKGRERFGGDWTVHAYDFESAETGYYLVVFTDDSEKNRHIKLYNDERTHVAYIAIDNLEELEQNEKSIYREASVAADRIIKEWAYGYGAFIKEYDREKYFMLFSHSMLEKMESAKFNLIEKISETKYGPYLFGVTVSMGISNASGTLAEKNAVAQSALEMALQRGGNQAALVSESKEYKFFGARTTTSQKRSGVHHRVFADKLIERIKHSGTVIIMGHQNPDFDAIGSCAGLSVLCKALDTKAYIVLKNQFDSNISECVNKIKSVPGYNIFIDPTSANNLCDDNTLILCSDVNNPKNFEAPDLATNAKHLFIIDHHRQNDGTPKPFVEYQASKEGEEGAGKITSSCETLIVPSASSASELVSEILDYYIGGLQHERTELPHDIADVMYAGILLDTKNFTRNTQVQTFEAAIYLRGKGADTVKAQSLFKTGLEDFMTESTFAGNIEIYRGNFAISTGNDIASGNKRVSAAKSADRLLNIKNVRASFVATELEPGNVFISARSDGTVNVQLIMEGLHGGGHYNAAATMLIGATMEEGIAKLKLNIDKYMGADTPSEEILVKNSRKAMRRLSRR